MFPFDIYGLALVSAFATTLLAVPLWRSWSYRAGLVDDPGHRKIHDRPISLAGGLAVLTGLLVPAILGALWLAGSKAMPALRENGIGAAGVDWLSYGLGRRGTQLAVILLGAMAMTLLGWWDDKHELRAAPKFAAQVFVALLIAAAGIRITLFVPSLLFSYAITVLWILAVINAFNFMDNMNGLTSGLGIIAAWLFGWSAALQGQFLVALLAFLTCGALLGFLPFNFPKASVFLGDAGSHLVGYMLAVLAILPNYYTVQTPRPWAVLTPLFILAVPLLDLAWVVLLRWRAGQPFYIGDTNHLSHRLVRRGWTRSQAVMIIWLAAALIGSAAFL
jgi:UDP-GlcNAc:undecaprenyl-phosphate/decaprenyl-phosphate GlcNAc-1-phosphate transferase